MDVKQLKDFIKNLPDDALINVFDDGIETGVMEIFKDDDRLVELKWDQSISLRMPT